MTEDAPYINPSGVKTAKIVLTPGDPSRVQYIAENFLENVEQFNAARNAFSYAGTYKGKEASVMGSGMGIPSIDIYSYELCHFFDVDTIIHVGSYGAPREDVNLYNMIIAQVISTNPNYVDQFNIPGHFAPIAGYNLVARARKAADETGAISHVGNVSSSDAFYDADSTFNDSWKKMGTLGIGMESAGLYLNAIYAGEKALGIFIVSDHTLRDEATSTEKRRTSPTQVVEIALEIAEQKI